MQRPGKSRKNIDNDIFTFIMHVSMIIIQLQKNSINDNVVYGQSRLIIQLKMCNNWQCFNFWKITRHAYFRSNVNHLHWPWLQHYLVFTLLCCKSCCKIFLNYVYLHGFKIKKLTQIFFYGWFGTLAVQKQNKLPF